MPLKNILIIACVTTAAANIYWANKSYRLGKIKNEAASKEIRRIDKMSKGSYILLCAIYLIYIIFDKTR